VFARRRYPWRGERKYKASDGRIVKLSRKPKIDHEYHTDKDKTKMTIQEYSPNKQSRNAIMKKLTAQLEGSPDRLVVDLKTKSKTEPGKKLRGLRKVSKLAEVGD
jgi:hypothetical protein